MCKPWSSVMIPRVDLRRAASMSAEAALCRLWEMEVSKTPSSFDGVDDLS